MPLPPERWPLILGPKTKTSAALPAVLGGTLLGGASAFGASEVAQNPYDNPYADAARGAGIGAGLTALGVGASRLPSWAVLPVTLAGAGLTLASLQTHAPQGAVPSMRSGPVGNYVDRSGDWRSG